MDWSPGAAKRFKKFARKNADLAEPINPLF
jgi:hypothetical protein